MVGIVVVVEYYKEIDVESVVVVMGIVGSYSEKKDDYTPWGASKDYINVEDNGGVVLVLQALLLDLRAVLII